MKWFTSKDRNKILIKRMILNRYLKFNHRLFNLFLFFNCILSLFTPLPTFLSLYFIFSLLCFSFFLVYHFLDFMLSSSILEKWLFSISSHCLRIDDIFILYWHTIIRYSFPLAAIKFNIYIYIYIIYDCTLYNFNLY